MNTNTITTPSDWDTHMKVVTDELLNNGFSGRGDLLEGLEDLGNRIKYGGCMSNSVRISYRFVMNGFRQLFAPVEPTPHIDMNARY